MRRNATRFDRRRRRALLAIGGLLIVATVAAAGDATTARRVCTLEDIYGDTGNRFQGAIGFQVREARGATEAISGFGLAVDDVVLQWREFTLEDDQSECAFGGACATISLQANNLFAGNMPLHVSVADTTPWPENDCDLDGTFDGTRDCDGDGVDDVVVRVTSAVDLAGEIASLNRAGRAVYKGSVAVSASFDMPGVVFVAAQGNLVPTVTAVYLDLDDGTGGPCQANVDPAAWGRVQTSSSIFITPGFVQITGVALGDNGDDDGWADDHETVRMRLEAMNKTGAPITGLTLRATSNDPDIACVTVPFLAFGDLRAGERRFGDGEIEFVVGAVERESVHDDLTATFTVTMDADQFQSTARPQSVTIDLDLDAVGGSGPTTWFEGFESGMGAFVPMPIDDALNPPDDDLGNTQAGVINSDGFRCQYTDPIRCYGPQCSGGATCYPSPYGAPDTFWFQPTDDRAFSGMSSLYWGVVLDPALGFTTPTAQLEAIRTEEPVNLGWARVCEVDRGIACDTPADCPSADGPQACVPAQPTLDFKHQISLLDHRTVNAQAGRAPERAVVQAQVADDLGNGIGNWIKLVPFVNTYDSQANSNYFNCTFDPTDDGNTEDDYFDPTNPARRFGPSSTCAPEFAFADGGETAFPFSAARTGGATDGPGLEGAHGLGTWIESRIDLSRFRGRRVHLRFLATGLKVGSIVHWEQIFVFNPDPRDDGWWIDDVRVTDALQEAGTVMPDLADNGALPGCGSVCDVAIAAAVVTPAASRAPGQAVTLDATPSHLPRCVGGVPQYLFAVDVDGDGALTRGLDPIVREWADDPTLLAAPRGDVDYLVGMRCGTAPDCADVAVLPIEVDCPTNRVGLQSGASFATAFLGRAHPALRALRFTDRTRLVWSTAATVDVVRGDLAALRGNGGFADGRAIDACLLDNGERRRTLADGSPDPAPGAAWFYLARNADRCNEKAGGSWGGVGEAAPRDLAINGAPAGCPE